jgi:hypothetical protein
MEITSEYQKDFYAWLMDNARLLREKKFTEIDAEHIAEELEAMGKSEKRELVNRLTVLLAHLLKWQFQSAKRSRSWKNTILTQRIDVNELLEDSPSLRHEIIQKIEVAYEKAKLSAEDETGIDKSHFPESCPFSLAKILEKEFFPEGGEGI